MNHVRSLAVSRDRVASGQRMRVLLIGVFVCGCASSSRPPPSAPVTHGATSAPVQNPSATTAPLDAQTDELPELAGTAPSLEVRRVALERWRLRSRITMYVGAGMFVFGGTNMAIGLALQAESRREGGDGDDGLYTLGAPIIGGTIGAAGLVTLLAGATSFAASSQELRKLPPKQAPSVRIAPLVGGYPRAPRIGLSLDLRF